jgi:N-acetylglucosaminyldiphosphoundecaprenol N-acetyl-beta-D-mannosaminyltransferase
MTVGGQTEAIAKRDLLGVPVALTDYQRAMNAMDEMIERRAPGYVCAMPVHGLMVARHDPEMRAALLGATLNVPDGKPLVWALSLLGDRLPDRVYGPDLMALYCERSAERGYRVCLYGGHDEGALALLTDALRARFPKLNIVGSYSPAQLPSTPSEERETAERINRDSPDLVWVGLGVPRQEKWMARMRSQLEAPVLVGVGAAFDFLSGRKKQAPRWMQQRGLEWAFRLSQEPVRLFPRYARYNPAFVVAFLRQYAAERSR